MKLHRTFALWLALLAALSNGPLRAAENDELIFDNDAVEFAEGVQIVNGKIVLT